MKIKNFFSKLLLLICVAFAFSCNNPDGKIYDTTSEPAGWDQGKQVFTEYVIIQPTWGQSFHYYIKTGGAFEISIGCVLFFGAVFWFILLTQNIVKVSLLNILMLVALLIASAAFIFTGPGTIKWNNSIRVEKRQYEQSKDNLPALWDQLYDERRIVGTSGK